MSRTRKTAFNHSLPMRQLASCLLLATGMPLHAQTLGIAYGGGGASGSPGNGVATGGTGGNAGVSGPTAGSDSRSGNGGGNGGTALSGSPISGANGGNAYDGSGMDPADGAGGGAGGFGIVLSNASGNLHSNATITGGTGGVGGWGSYGGGGGGGGGSALYVGTSINVTALIINSAITGGAGGVGGTSGGGGYNTTSGAGGNSSGSGGSGAVGNNGSGGGSGGGGGGGVQFVSTASGTTTITNTASVTGGNGGNGGRDGGGNGRGGNGGNGGNGIALSGSYIRLTNTGNVTGGNGGQPGPCDTFCTGGAGSGGSGGVGLVVSGGGNTIVNSGSISGGLAANGTTRANAMTLSGGGNTLELRAGYAFNGNVVSSSGTTNGGDTLTLGGSTNTSFDLSQIGARYQGFNNFQKTGSGTWVVTGSTTTAWHITDGTLQIGTGGTSGAINGDISNDASLVFNRSNAVTYSSVISGTGGLTKLGAGTLTLTGANTYDGGTTIDAGTLAIGAGGSLAASGALNLSTAGAAFDIANGGHQSIGSLAGVAGTTVALGGNNLTVAGNAATTFAGVISGTGALIKNGVSTLTLTGANAYTGGTIINSGTLTIGTGGSLAATGAVVLASAGAALDMSGSSDQTIGSLAGVAGTNVNLGSHTLTVGDGSNTTFTGTIGGTGSLVKQGSGTLTLAGNNTYAGNTTISAGTLSLSNNYIQTSSQTLGIGASSNASYGKLVVGGTATFNADANIAIDVATSNTLAKGQKLSGVISAGTLHATTFNVTDNSALFNFSAVLSGNAVDLNIISSSMTGVYDAVVGERLNSAQGAARVLDTFITGTPTGDMANVVNALGQLPTQRDVARAAAQTLPIGFGTQAIQGVLSSFGRVLQGRLGSSGLSAGDAPLNKQAWAKGFGSRADQDDRSGAAGFSAESWGLAFGADAEVAAGSRVGVAYGYAKTSVTGNIDLAGTGQNAGIDSHMLALYGNQPLATDLDLVYQADVGLNNNKGTRHISFGGLSRTATSDYRTYTAHAGVGLNKTLVLSTATTFIPGVRADYVWLHSQSYAEAGAGALNLNVDSDTTDALLLGADGRLVHKLDERSSLSVNLGVAYDAINKRGNIVSTYAGAPTQSFATQGIDHDPWLVRSGLGFNHKTAGGTDIALRYDAEGRSGFLNQTASIKATWAF